MTDITFRKAKADRILFTLFLVLAVAAFAWTFTFPKPAMRGQPGAGLFPQLILVAMALFCISGLWRNIKMSRAVAKGAAAPVGFDDEIRLRAGALTTTVVGLGLFIALLQFAGMEPAVFLYLGVTLYMRTRRALLALTCAALGTAGVYFIFMQALGVHLPLMFLPRYPGWW
jgi:hypothetical protein